MTLQRANRRSFPVSPKPAPAISAPRRRGSFLNCLPPFEASQWLGRRGAELGGAAGGFPAVWDVGRTEGRESVWLAGRGEVQWAAADDPEPSSPPPQLAQSSGNGEFKDAAAAAACRGRRRFPMEVEMPQVRSSSPAGRGLLYSGKGEPGISPAEHSKEREFGVWGCVRRFRREFTSLSWTQTGSR